MSTVMVVDDSRFMREEIAHLLQGTGYTICAQCRDAEEALALYPSVLPQFVLMDIVLPGMDGIDATTQILASWPSARVVMVSSMSYDKDMAGAKKSGAKSFLCKPFKVEDLLHALEEAAKG